MELIFFYFTLFLYRSRYNLCGISSFFFYLCTSRYTRRTCSAAAATAPYTTDVSETQGQRVRESQRQIGMFGGLFVAGSIGPYARIPQVSTEQQTRQRERKRKKYTELCKCVVVECSCRIAVIKPIVHMRRIGV